MNEWMDEWMDAEVHDDGLRSLPSALPLDSSSDRQRERPIPSRVLHAPAIFLSLCFSPTIPHSSSVLRLSAALQCTHSSIPSVPSRTIIFTSVHPPIIHSSSILPFGSDSLPPPNEKGSGQHVHARSDERRYTRRNKGVHTELLQVEREGEGRVPS
mmetsp:Transcript_40779/g.80355  ORF Transcript_40779/g.80355 Transcript_40779/m.80355 type:complete len:156 (+) Transcript_40779:10-477(+)